MPYAVADLAETGLETPLLKMTFRSYAYSVGGQATPSKSVAICQISIRRV